MEKTNILADMPDDCLKNYDPEKLGKWIADKISQPKLKRRALMAYCQCFGQPMSPEDFDRISGVDTGAKSPA